MENLLKQSKINPLSLIKNSKIDVESKESLRLWK